MLFPILSFDPVVSVNDMIRLDASRCLAPKGSSPISKVELEPETGSGFINITGGSPVSSKNWFLDWVYTTAGNKTITLKVEQADSTVTIKTFTISVVTEASDFLYCSDADLIPLEPDILDYLPKGRSSYKFVHRKVQQEILDWLERSGVTRRDGSKLEKTDLNVTNDIRSLATNWSLMLIFDSLSNKTDDKFYQKFKSYASKVEFLKSRVRFFIDFDGDGSVDSSERINIRSGVLLRR